MTGDWSALIGPLVDGEALDWPTLERTLGSDSEDLRRLRRIAALCSGLAAAHPPRPGAPYAGTGGFAWGHLRVLERLGSGSSGEVHRAFDTVLEREVALKLLRDDGAGQARAFIAEARRLARVRHPNVLAVHGAAVHDGRAGIWSDRIVGLSLRAYVASSGPRPAPEALAVAGQLAAALQAVHGAGLVHGDVKPGNVMREAEGGRIVLMDFGSAASRAEAQRHGLLGSPLSMAPEQLRGEPVGPAADLYGLGVVLFHQLTGRLPVLGEDIASVAQSHARDQARRAALDLPLAPAPRHLLADLLAADPARRPDADAVLARLARIASAPARRRRRLAVAAVVAGLGLGLVAALVGLRQAAVERDRARAAGAEQAAVSDFLAELLSAPGLSMAGAEVRVRDVLDGAAAGVDGQMAAHPAAQVRVLATIGNSYRNLGLHAQARDTLQQALARVRALHPPDSAPVLDIESMLAEVAGSLDPPDQALAQVDAVLARAERSLGARHRITVFLMLDKAILLQQQDRLAEARALLEEVLARRPASPGAAADSQRLAALQRLGAAVLDDGDSVAAERLLRQALAEYEDGPGDRQGRSNAFAARNDLLRLLIAQGDLGAAEVEARRLLDEAAALFGPEHGNLRSMLGTLGGILVEQDRHAEAVVHLERAAVLAERHDPPGSVRRLNLQGNLANALAGTGALERARVLREDNYALALRELGASHPTTLVMHNNLAEQRLLDGRATDAEALATAMAGRARERFGDDHLFTLEGSEVAARARLAQGRTTALAELATICARKDQVLGAGHSHALGCRLHLAPALAAAGRAGDARRQLGEALAAARASHGDDHALVARVATALAALPADGTP